VLRYFACADLLLVTLRKEPIFALTIPSKVQSYLACAKPIIAALAVEESGGGLDCSLEDPQALADAVLRVHSMTTTEREDMDRRGRDYFLAQFEWTSGYVDKDNC
jgi:glycosyltransferase involved in cell wall biosynthesis